MVISTPWLRKTIYVFFCLLSLFFWIGIWAFVAKKADSNLILPSPQVVWEHFTQLLEQKSFYQSLWISVWHILVGFFFGVLFGVLLAICTHFLRPTQPLFAPLLLLLRATPVASFSLLAYYWMETEQIPSLMAAIMVLPIVCAGMRSGLAELDRSLQEMLSLYQVPFWRRLRYFYIPSLLPYFSACAVTSFGLAWKAGVAAEILVTPKNSIGYHLYNAKIYLETEDLFAYTLVVILCSLICESVLRLSLRRHQAQVKSLSILGGVA